MNDDDVITTVRESFTGVHSTTSTEQIVQRARAVRARRLIPGGAGALAVATAAALTLTALTPAGHRATSQPAAWTVAKLADGNISVRIRELVNPTRLQRALRADGVPASVTFAGRLNPACRHYPASEARRHMVFLPPPGRAPSPARKVMERQSPGTIAFVIDLSALPAGTGVQIAWPQPRLRNLVIRPGERAPSLSPGPQPLLDLVYASPACTGS